MTKVLIVEDEPKVAQNIRQGLVENGFEADIANDGLNAKRMFEANKYDVIVLDIILPEIGGVDLCKYFKTQKPDIKVIMLTALGTLEDKLTGFDAGADDYLSKPFDFLELLARIKSLLKRSEKLDEAYSVLSIADLELNLNTKIAIRNGVKIDLTAKEFALLEYLLRNKGRVVSRVDIAEKVWDITFDTGTNVIDVYINFLRKKIDKNYETKLLHTLIGMGYILKADN